MKPSGTLLLTRKDLARLLGPQDYLEIVEAAFRAHAEGRALDRKSTRLNSSHGKLSRMPSSA